MFQPTRPSLRWSRVEIWRANSKGCWRKTELVAARPMFSVAEASAESSTSGSALGNWTPSRAVAFQSPP